MTGWLVEHGVRAARVALGLLGALVLLGAAALLASCSSGPQLPIVTVPMSISCSWNVRVGEVPERDASVTAPSGTDGTAGVIVADNDCSIDRSAASADPRTTGNEVGPVNVSPETEVSAIPGAP